MSFSVALPAPALRPYIARYWSLRADYAAPEKLVLLPDTGIHLLFVLGDPVRSGRFATTFGRDRVHLVGAMLQADHQILAGEQHHVGVTFEPAAFSSFYSWDPLSVAADRVVPFEIRGRPSAIDAGGALGAVARRLDRYFLDRLMPRTSDLHRVVADIRAHGGNVRIDALLKRHAMTARTLERRFAKEVGITPKELIDVTRFRHALGELERDGGRRSLMEIAWDCGYYDNAHLTREFRRFMGEAPSRVALSDLSKSASG